MRSLKILIYILIFIALTIKPILTIAQLPDLGDSSQRSFTPEKEKELGQYFILSLKTQVPFVHDPIVYDYINNLGYRLVAACPDPSRTFHFFVVDDPTINAFSGPAGYVGINSGLILATQSESELAAVMSHEIAHTVQGHIAQAYAAQQHMELPALGAALASIAIGVVNPEAGMGALTASTAGLYQNMLNYSRGYEREADRVGMQILANAKYDPRSMPAFFDRLQRDSRLNGDDVPELLRTHPVTEERLADAYNRSTQYPPRKVPESKTFLLIQGRLMVNNNDPIASTKRLENQLKHNPNNLKIHYAYTLSLLNTHQFTEAQKQIQSLLKQDSDNVILKITEANIDQQANQTQNALKIMENLYQYNSDYYPVIMNYANILMDQKQNKKAAEILKTCYDQQKSNEDYLLALSQALGHSNQLTEAYQVRARIYLMYADREGAITQLKMAEKYAKNNYTKKHIQAEINKLKKKS